MGTNFAPLVANLFLFCYERDFMMSLSDDKQADVIDAFKDIENLAIILVPLNMTLSRGHTGQIKS